MNVRFFAGTKQQYLSIPVHNEQALYFCEDTKELFWGDRLLTDGIRVVPTFADLPTSVEAIADGMLYYVTETRNGYVLSPDRTEWLQTIYAPATDAYKVPESEIYNTVTTVGAVRDIEEKIYKAIDDVKTECTAKAISFAGIEMEEVDGVFTIDRACARRAMGLNVPEGLEDAEISVATEDYVKNAIAEAELNNGNVDLSGLATKDELANVEAKIPSTDGLATETFVHEMIAKAELEDKEADLEAYYTKDQVDALIPDVSKFITEIPSEYITEEKLNAKGYITEHQDLSEYAKKTDIPSIEGLASETYVDEKVAAIELTGTDVYKVDFNAPDYAKAVEAYNSGKVLVLINAAPDINSYAVMNYVSEKYITFTKFLTSRSEAYGLFNTYYLSQANTWELSKEVKLNKVEANVDGEVTGELTSIRIGKEIYSIPNTDGLATTEYVNNAINNIEIPEVNLSDYAKKSELPSVEGLASEEFVLEQIKAIELPESDLTNYYNKSEVDTKITKAIATKADNVPFTTDKYVTKQLGGFNVDDNLNGLTVVQILAKLLELSDSPMLNPDEPEIPEEPTGIIANIIANRVPMYAVNANGDLEVIPYEFIELTEETAAQPPTKSGFYQIKDASGNVIESGYQELQADSDDVYYVIALPKDVDYDTMVTVYGYDDNFKVWREAEKFKFASDPIDVAAICDESDIDISHIDTAKYNIFAIDECPTGSKLRFIINE